MTRICCLVFAKLDSTRVPRKLLQDVGGRTLLQRGVDYLAMLRDETGITPLVICPPGDMEIIAACDHAGIASRDDMVHSSNWPGIIAPHVRFLEDNFDWVWDANIFCHPFLRLETGKKIVERMQTTACPFTVVTATNGLVWNEARALIHGWWKLANTKTNPTYYQLAHIAYCWPVEFLGLDEERLAKAVVPAPLPLHWSEVIDIDTPDDLEHARAVASHAEQWYAIPLSKLFPGKQ